MMEAPRIKQRDPGLDVLRALAIVMVLVIHSASGSLSQAPHGVNWWAALAWGRLPGLRCRCSSCAPAR